MIELINFQVILTHFFYKLAKYYWGLKWTDEEEGIHPLKGVDWKVAC